MASSLSLVTGAASGIGRATALAFAAEGKALLLADLDEKGGEETARLVQALGAEAIFQKTDVTSEESIGELIRIGTSQFGPLRSAVNCAGVEMTGYRTADCPLSTWNDTVAVNLTGIFVCVKAELASMLETGGGAIVNLSSVAGLLGLRGQVAYSASKHGVIGITKTVALEYAHLGIRSNAVCPGPVDTPLLRRGLDHDPAKLEAMKGYVPADRISEPAEIASVAVWLCSEGASYLNGQAVPVDGGLTAQ